MKNYMVTHTFKSKEMKAKFSETVASMNDFFEPHIFTECTDQVMDFNAKQEQTMKKAYLVAVPTVTNPDMFAKEYASKVADTLKPFDGKFLVRTPEKLVKEGEETTLTVVIEFPNKDKALGWYNSDEHQKIVVQRRKATDPKSTIVICEESDSY